MIKLITPAGKIKEYKGHSIVTRFFGIGLPILPLGSYYKVSESVWYEIPVNSKSIWIGYSRTTLFAIGLILNVVANNEFHNSPLGIVLQVFSIILIANGIYNWARKTMSANELFVRQILSKTFDYNMLPDYLSPELSNNLLDQLKLKYFVDFQKLSWEEDIEKQNVNSENSNILFSLAYYTAIIGNEEKYVKLFQTIKKYMSATNQASSQSKSKTEISKSTSLLANKPTSLVKAKSENVQKSNPTNIGTKNTEPIPEVKQEKIESLNKVKPEISRFSISESEELEEIKEKNLKVLLVGAVVVSLIMFIVYLIFSSKHDAGLGMFVLVGLVIYGILFSTIWFGVIAKINDDFDEDKKVTFTAKVTDINHSNYLGFKETVLILASNPAGITKVSIYNKDDIRIPLFSVLILKVAKASKICLSYEFANE